MQVSPKQNPSLKNENKEAPEATLQGVNVMAGVDQLHTCVLCKPTNRLC